MSSVVHRLPIKCFLTAVWRSEAAGLPYHTILMGRKRRSRVTYRDHNHQCNSNRDDKIVPSDLEYLCVLSSVSSLSGLVANGRNDRVMRVSITPKV